MTHAEYLVPVLGQNHTRLQKMIGLLSAAEHGP